MLSRPQLLWDFRFFIRGNRGEITFIFLSQFGGKTFSKVLWEKLPRFMRKKKHYTFLKDEQLLKNYLENQRKHQEDPADQKKIVKLLTPIHFTTKTRTYSATCM